VTEQDRSLAISTQDLVLLTLQENIKSVRAAAFHAREY